MATAHQGIFCNVTAPSGPDSTSAHEQDAFDSDPVEAGADHLVHLDNSASRRLIATAVGVGSPAVRALADWLAANGEVLEGILDASLSDPERLKAVTDTGLLDSGPYAAIDSIAQMTAEAIGTPFASVSLVLNDRQFVVGCNVGEGTYPRSGTLDLSLSKFIVVSGEPLIVNDASLHPLLADHPAVRGGALRAFAGIPLADGRGNVVGTVSVWDSDRHHWTIGQVQLLSDLTDVAAASIFGESAFRPPADPVPPVTRSTGKLKRFVSRRRGV